MKTLMTSKTVQECKQLNLLQLCCDKWKMTLQRYLSWVGSNKKRTKEENAKKRKKKKYCSHFCSFFERLAVQWCTDALCTALCVFVQAWNRKASHMFAFDFLSIPLFAMVMI
mmetsp:Transcript_27934/g.71082  ORF Transcript_27934/g.71082 Transcript_27934/m.71082 type:complete len:112 (+) Transcript_27934:237-572(+)